MNAEDITKMPRNPIYDAPIDQQLMDIEMCARSCRGMVKNQIMESSCWERPVDPANSEGLNEGEFAIGNWIVRPRF